MGCFGPSWLLVSPAKVRWFRLTDSRLSLARSGERRTPLAGQRRGYDAEFKAKVALEALKSELTIAQRVAKHGVHQTLINS